VNTPKPPPIYITGVTNISPLIQLLEQIAKQRYEINALADNKVKVQPKSSDSYTELHTYNLKDERSYRVVLKNMHYSINPEEIKTN
jgi:hypothetical protein